MSSSLRLTVAPLHLPMKTTFKQASSSRNTGESVWVTATRGQITGYGEGCPRTYVTGEDVASCLAWLEPRLAGLEQECIDLQRLREKVNADSAAIDRHPAAWCAVETALLDLFAREQERSVENMLGLDDPLRSFQYTAVLGDSSQSSFEQLIKRYLSWGFSDFKVKVNGDLRKDQAKLTALRQICSDAGLEKIRIRLDANNLWSDQAEAATGYLAQLDGPLLGIEEPVEPKNPIALHTISTTLSLPVILDESLCTLQDLAAYDHLAGRYIANIKVSRVGGVLRSLQLVEALQARGWRIIVGAHVGETSVMTRAGMCVAQAAGDSLIAQEGAFGTILLEKEPVHPSLMFGAGGRLDLSRSYVVKTLSGAEEYPVTTWSKGWGVEEG